MPDSVNKDSQISTHTCIMLYRLGHTLHHALSIGAIATADVSLSSIVYAYFIRNAALNYNVGQNFQG